MDGLLREEVGACRRPAMLRDCFRILGVLSLLLLPGIRPASAQPMTLSPSASNRPVVIIRHAVTRNRIQQIARLGQSAHPSLQTGGTTRRPARIGGRRPAGSLAGRRPARPRIHRPVARRPASSAPTKGAYAPGRPGAAAGPFLGHLPAFNFAHLPVFRRQPAPVAARPQPAPVAPAPSVSPQPGMAQAGGNGAFETQEVSLISQYRQQNGLNALTIDPNFSAIALGHSQDMANRQSMDHNGFDQRFAQAQQYGVTRCVENVAWNYNDPQSLFSAWQNSPEHNANMLDSAIRRAGVAIVNGYSTFFACN